LRKNMAIELSGEGKRQIEMAAQKLKKNRIDLIFSSDFLRAKQTAKIVAKELGVKNIKLDKRLRDINLGVYHGQRKANYYRDFPIDNCKNRFDMRPKKGESWNEVEKRMLNFLNDIEKKYRGKRILIVSHGDPLWLLEGAVKNWSKKKMIFVRKNNYINKGELRKLKT